LAQVAIGMAAALIAVAIRYSLPLSPLQVPTLTVVVAVAIVTTFVGTAGGIATAIAGGLLSWYVFFTPFSWELTPDGVIPLLAFSVIAAVIVTTSHLYRASEERNHQAQLAAARKHAEDAELFAREMAHRLKNALTIVQSIAFQTLGEAGDTSKFAARLKALADAHELLSEHVERPTARVADVVRAALEPFVDGGGERVRVDCADARVAAQQVVSLALAVHELGTNASKYGALSDAKGWVSVKIEDTGDRIRLTWREHDGPRVQPPHTDGFGTRLLRRIGSGTELSFEPGGVRCSFYLRKA